MTPRKQFRLLAVLAAVVGAFAVAAPAASAETPAPGYSQFAGCPSPKSENPAVIGCLRTEITGGKFKLGNKNVPINQTLTLSGGTIPGGPEGAPFITANSKGGLSPVKLPVPGGVIGLTGLDWLINFLSLNDLKLYAEAQIAGPPILFGPEEVQLPLRMHLINSVLGNNCYVGSFSTPVVLKLTTHTSGKLTGKEPEYSFDAKEIFHGNNGTFVDGTFTAPEANGCQLTLFGFLPIDLDPIVNLASGLPAGSGTNEAVQNYNLEAAEAHTVYP